jgi:hypothetical protein
MKSLPIFTFLIVYFYDIPEESFFRVGGGGFGWGANISK